MLHRTFSRTAQVNLLPQQQQQREGGGPRGGGVVRGHVEVRVFSVNSHRLAQALQSKEKLLPIVQVCLARQRGLRSGNTRVSNIL